MSRIRVAGVLDGASRRVVKEVLVVRRYLARLRRNQRNGGVVPPA